MEVGHLWKCR